ncbi:transposase family protein [Streptomyces sp. NPDC087843]|uniref:transposase family protein n=1 Tax=Streptomyces sp. NPDC087843 TaxID=3365804 RepID=UPI00380BB827
MRQRLLRRPCGGGGVHRSLGPCPDCRKRARRTHSSYQRDLNERPLGSHQVIVRLRVRRYEETVSQRPLDRSPRAGQRHTRVPGDPGLRLPRQPPGCP